MAKKRRKSSSLSRAIGVTGKCFMRYEMKKRCGIGRRRPKKQVVKYNYLQPEEINGRRVTHMCYEDYDVILSTVEEYNFMIQNGRKVDFANDRYDVCLQNQAYNKQILNAFRIEKVQKQERKSALRTLGMWSIIAVAIIGAIVF